MENNKTDLAKILSVSGQHGLFRFLAQARTGAISESLADGRRTCIDFKSKITTLADISIYTSEGELKLQEVFKKLHETLGAYIVEQAEACSKTGEPIVRSMDYAFPGQGFETCIDQYMLGDKYLVAPVMDDTFSRTVTLPKGKWQDEYGKVYRGGKTYTLDVPLDRLPYFTKK